ncbi:MAG: imelysin family protein, partial [Paludibacteraceae bacterium]
MKKTKLFAAICLLGMSLAGCQTTPTGGQDTDSPKETALKAAMEAYVDNTVVPTYRSLADATIALYAQCETMLSHFDAGKLTEADLKAAANEWEHARKYWELSEAFLFGPAANHNIDPHIDSWPLDKDAMDELLGDTAKMAQIEAHGADYVGDKLGYGLLGFHAVEYMLYASDNDDKSNVRLHPLNYTRAEMVYLLAVAEDLRNQTVALEASWAGVNNISEEKQTILEEAEIEYNDFTKGYGSYMKVATGGIYATYQEAAEELMQGCIDIADEVGNTKIG